MQLSHIAFAILMTALLNLVDMELSHEIILAPYVNIFMSCTYTYGEREMTFELLKIKTIYFITEHYVSACE